MLKPSSCLVAMVCMACLFNPLEVRAQQGGMPGAGPPTPVPSEPGLASAQFGDIVAGHFRHPLLLDAVVLDDGEPVLLRDPELFRDLMRGGYQPEANGIAVLEGVLPNALDALLVAHSGGLDLLRWDTATDAWLVDTLDSTSWAGARCVVVGDLDGTGGLDAAGLCGSVGSIALALDYSGGASGSFASYSSATRPVASTAAELHLLDWDVGGADAADEIVVLSASGLEVYDGDATPTAFLPGNGNPALGVPVRSIDGQEELCVATSLDGVTDSLLFLGELGLSAIHAVGDVDPVAVNTWDRDGDGDTDIIVSVASAPEFITLTYVSACEPTCGTSVQGPLVGSLAFGDPSRDPSGNQAHAVAADFDYDGDEDLLAPVQGEYVSGLLGTLVPSDLELIRGVPVDESTMQAGIADSKAGYDPDLDPHENALWLGFIPPSIVPSGPPGSTPKLVLESWRAPSLYSSLELDPFDVSAPLAQGSGSYRVLLGQPDLVFNDLYVMIMRSVAVNSADEIVARGPSQTAFFVDMANYPNLQGWPGVSALSLTLHKDPDENQPAGGTGTGPRPPGTGVR